jgi:hypothetical protein
MQRGQVDPIRSPVELVRLLPSYARHPVVADANVLFQDTQRYVKTGFTVLTSLARYEVITLLTSEHVRQRLPEVMAERSIDPSAQQRVWRQVYLPLVRFVEVPDSMCAGHSQIEAIVDLEDRPFARLAVATAPGLLLTRDHHFDDVGLGTAEWADALTVLGGLVELDVSLYGSAHTAVILAWLFGLFARRAWQTIAAEPLLSIVGAGVGVLLLLDNKDEVIRRARAARVAITSSGARLLDAATLVLQEWEEAKGNLASRLEQPMLPRSVESICARQMATRRVPVSTEALLAACEGAGSPVSMSGLTRFLRGHSSFTVSSPRMWELGRLGCPTIDGTIRAEDEPQSMITMAEMPRL